MGCMVPPVFVVWILRPGFLGKLADDRQWQGDISHVLFPERGHLTDGANSPVFRCIRHEDLYATGQQASVKSTSPAHIAISIVSVIG